MPKIKTNSGSKKRFVLTGTGKIKRQHAYHSHTSCYPISRAKEIKLLTECFSLKDHSCLAMALTFKKTKNYAKISKSCCF